MNPTSQGPAPAATPSPDTSIPPLGQRTGRRGRLPKWALGIIAVLGMAAVASVAVWGELGLVSVITTVFMYIVLAQAWNILGGYGGYLNLGMAAFFGVGAYTTAILFDRLGLAWFVSLLLAGLASALLAIVIGFPSLRLRGAYFAILTLVITFLVQTYAYNSGLTRGAMGMFMPGPATSPRLNEQIFFSVFFVLALTVTGVVLLVERSKFGYALRAIREDEDASEVLGIRTTRVKMNALILGSFLAGLAGGLYSYRIGYIEPAGVFDLSLSIDVVLVTVVGGAGSWLGPLIGAPLVLLVADTLRVAVTRVEIFGSSVPTEVNRVVFGLILITVALYARHGIVGLFRQARGRRFQV